MILTQIQEHLQLCDKQHLAQHLKYNSLEKANKVFNAILNAKSLSIFLTRGYYDFTHTPESLISALTEYFQLDQGLLAKELKAFQYYKDEKIKLEGSYIFVNTNFKRKNEPIFALAALESKRRIDLYDLFNESFRQMELQEIEEFYFKTSDEILILLGDFIKNHYQDNIDGLPVFGKIVNYQVYLFGEYYQFDIYGNRIIGGDVISENIATLRLN